MAITIRQSNQGILSNNTTSGTLLNVTMGSTPNNGNLLLSFGEGAFCAVTAATGYTLIDNGTTNDDVLSQYRIASSDTTTQPCITTNGTTSQGVAGVVYEIVGQAVSGFINQHNHSLTNASGTTAGNTITTASITPTVNNCLIIAAVAYSASGAGGSSVTASGSFNVDQKAYAPGAVDAAMVVTASFIQSGAASVSCTFTNNNPIAFINSDTFILAIAPNIQTGGPGAGEMLLLGVG